MQSNLLERLQIYHRQANQNSKKSSGNQITKSLSTFSTQELSTLICMNSLLEIDGLNDLIAKYLLSEETYKKFAESPESFLEAFADINASTQTTVIKTLSERHPLAFAACTVIQKEPGDRVLLLPNEALCTFNGGMKSISIHEYPGGPRLSIQLASTNQISDIAWHPKKPILAYCDNKALGSIYIWDGETKSERLLAQMVCRVGKPLCQIAWNAGGDKIACRSLDNVYIIDANTGTIINSTITVQCHTISWHPFEDTLAVAAQAGLSIYDITETAKTLIASLNEDFDSITWSHDGTKLGLSATGWFYKKKPFIFDLPNNKFHELNRIEDAINMTFTPDGNYLVLGCYGRIKLIDIANEVLDQPINETTLYCHPDSYHLVAWSPDDRLCISLQAHIFIFDRSKLQELLQNISIPQAMVLNHILQHDKLPWLDTPLPLTLQETKLQEIFESLPAELLDNVLNWVSDKFHIRTPATPLPLQNNAIGTAALGCNAIGPAH